MSFHPKIQSNIFRRLPNCFGIKAFSPPPPQSCFCTPILLSIGIPEAFLNYGINFFLFLFANIFHVQAFPVLGFICSNNPINDDKHYAYLSYCCNKYIFFIGKNKFDKQSHPVFGWLMRGGFSWKMRA